MERLKWNCVITLQDLLGMEQAASDLQKLTSRQNLILKGMIEKNHIIFSQLVNHFIVLNIAQNESLNKTLDFLNTNIMELLIKMKEGQA